VNICFVTTELSPYTAGGAGRVVSGLVEELQAAGHRARVILVNDDVGEVDDDRVELVRPQSDEISVFIGAAKAAAEAAARIAGGVDLFEFQDFQGLGYWALMRRRALGLDETLISIREHGPIDLISRHLQQPDPAQEHVRVMERQAFAMADFVIAASEPVAGELTAAYELEPERVVVGVPPVSALPTESKPARSARPEIAYFGTLAEVKGAEDFVEAAVPLAEEFEEVTFRLMGSDGWHSSGRPMSAVLTEAIPATVRHQFLFEGPSERDEISTELQSAWAVATPSRFETFCLAAHEARLLRIPVIVPDLAAFRPFFSLSTGALVFDSVADLSAAMRQVITEPPMLDRLVLAPPPTYGNPTEVYQATLPPMRHPRAQAGLGTAALARLEAAIAPPAPPPPPELHTRVARWLNRLPFPAARWVSNAIPEGHPYRSLAAWHDDFRERQPEIERRRSLTKAARRHTPSPARVTVVIACYNQGAFVEDAIYSVFAQTLKDWEIVVVNDGSDDPATVELLSDLNLPRTTVVNQSNAGLPAARNRGMKSATTDFVVPLDADDELETEFLAKLVSALDSNPDAGVAHCWTRLFGDLNQIWVPPPLNPYRLLLSNSLVGCAVVRTSVWHSIGGYDEDMTRGNEDWDFWLRMVENDVEMIEVAEPLFRYRRHGITMSVETEARFEQARREISAAHPDLYGRIGAIKQDHYPSVSILIGKKADLEVLKAQTVTDAELIPVGIEPAESYSWPIRDTAGGLSEAVALARGKFVVHWDQVRRAGGGDLDLLSRHLEADELAYAAGPDPTHPLLWRRWAMVDPNTPHTHVTAVPGTLSVDDTQQWKGQFPQDRYLFSADVEVVQVSPEADARVPEWVR